MSDATGSEERHNSQKEASLTTEAIYAQTSVVSDQPTSVDTLGFAVYVEAVTDFLLDPATQPPFTMSVEGPWGSGKSSFMLQVRKAISERSPKSVLINFNAWKYDKQEEVWAAFALAVSRSLRTSVSLGRRLFGSVKLFSLRLKSGRDAFILVTKFLLWVGIVMAFIGACRWSLKSSPQERFNVAQNSIETILSASIGSAKKEQGIAPQVSPKSLPQNSNAPAGLELRRWAILMAANSEYATGLILLVGILIKVPKNALKNLLEVKLEEYIDKPDYAGKAAFVDTFSEDFSKLISAYARGGKSKVFVFVDDLDRCEAPKAADLMQAINLMIGENSRLFFVIGLDRAKVASSIAYKFKDIVPYLDANRDQPQSAERSQAPDFARLRSFGDEFLEKFIQVSIRVPVQEGDDEQAKEFVDSLVQQMTATAGSSGFFKRVYSWIFGGPELSASSSQRRIPVPTALKPFCIEPGPESERLRAVLFSVRSFLGFNPRRLKIFLNRFRLSLNLASRQGLFYKDPDTGRSEVTPEQLGKFIALTSIYPEILDAALREPDLFKNMEFYLIHKDLLTEGKSESATYWLSRPGIRELLSPGLNITLEWMNTYSLEAFPVEKFVRILPELPAIQTSSEGRANERMNDEFLGSSESYIGDKGFRTTEERASDSWMGGERRDFTKE